MFPAQVQALASRRDTGERIGEISSTNVASCETHRGDANLTSGVPPTPTSHERRSLQALQAPSRQLPEKFAAIWKELNAANKPPEVLNNPVKLVVGIPASPYQPEVMKAHKDTWMKMPGVCDIINASSHRVGCSVFPIFLLGKSSESLHAAEAFTDALVLQDVAEPVFGSSQVAELYGDASTVKHNLGTQSARNKTYAWFEHAVKSYPWATHIAKMDSDTFPLMHLVLRDLVASPPNRTLYGELGMAAADWEDIKKNGRRGNALCDGGFMKGRFYIASTELQKCRLKFIEQAYAAAPVDHGAIAEDKWFARTLCEAGNAKICPEPTIMKTNDLHRFVHPL
eukprot:gnl/TRDRNA2_/TRDRNA2_168433_c0_seq1.p1 gnl/TRDRNA2_/TRDRNA2_168433_c0~~gnl/TRDRNA2_/TRDRNA2_168433_c0_seq1.p1  ORF type:complete len:364 (+),score=59.98 gnl/TRDRNA2_/TRDRNA2_168433_c0_seq1:74-1093(+)